MPYEILGIDIGGTGIKGAPVNVETGELLAERFRIKTPRPATPEAVAETAAKIAQHFSWTGPVGIGFPAVVKEGVVLTAGNIDQSWIGTNGRELFEKTIGCNVALINDADAAGLAEMHLGAAKGRSGVIIMVTLGTGIGTAIFHDGKLFPNSELGHLMLGKKDAERLASNSAREKNEWSWKKYGKRVSTYLNELHRLLWPDLFIIGGGVSNEWEKIAPHLELNCEAVPAKMANIAGIVGAALAPLSISTAHVAVSPVSEEAAAPAEEALPSEEEAAPDASPEPEAAAEAEAAGSEAS